MKIRIVSDLHFEFYSPEDQDKIVTNLKLDEVDGLIIAGDLYSIKELETFKNILRKFTSKVQVFYIPGNHEYWWNSFKNVDDILQKCEEQLDNLVVLRTGAVHKIGNKKLIGDTMWYPNSDTVKYNKSSWPDFTYITDSQPEIFLRNEWFNSFIRDVLDENTLVVTHMLPTPRSIDVRYQGAITNCFFLSDCTEQIINKEPFMWIHGHTHEPMDYEFNKTRIICNPRGYPREPRKTTFIDDFVINV